MKVAKFRKKPVVIDAWPMKRLLQYAKTVWSSLPDQVKDAYDAGGVVFNAESIAIRTMEGTMYATQDDWVICGVKGELYPCKRTIFLATYDMVNPSDGEQVLGHEHYAEASDAEAQRLADTFQSDRGEK
jgi:hypothetical protein